MKSVATFIVGILSSIGPPEAICLPRSFDTSENVVRTHPHEANFHHWRQTGSHLGKICARKTCDQFFTGRNLPYAKALQIVQQNDYLVEDEIKIKSPNRLVRRRGRFRRQSSSASTKDADQLSRPHLGTILSGSDGLKVGGMAAAAAAGGGAVAAFMALPGEALGVPGAGAGVGGVLPAVGQPIPGAGAAAIPPGAGPIPPGVGPGGVPIGQPIPGTVPGSGVLPLGNSPAVTEALALLEPLGLASGLVIPVAVFPSHPAGPAALPAVSIIFLEMSAAPVRRSLSLWISKADNLRLRAKRMEALTNRRNAFKTIRETIEKRLKKLAMNLKCFLPRLKHNLLRHETQNNSRLKQKLSVAVPIIQKRKLTRAGKKSLIKVTGMQRFAQNCFPQPLYGFRTKVVVKRDPCLLGVNCTTAEASPYPDDDEGNGDLTGMTNFKKTSKYINAPSSIKLLKRQSFGEIGFSSDRSPECRITLDAEDNCTN